MSVIVNETDIVLEPPKPQPMNGQAQVPAQAHQETRLRPQDLARIREQQRQRLLRVRAN
jgi:hypothetical protein